MEKPPYTEQGWVTAEARAFFETMLLGDARALVHHSAFPFQLEGKSINTGDELLQEWLKNLREKRTDLLTLYGVELLSPGEMEKKYGKPPARLQSIPWRNARTWVAVGNLSGHAAIAVFHDVGSGNWKV